MPSNHLINARTTVISIFTNECHEAAAEERLDKERRRRSGKTLNESNYEQVSKSEFG